jgi:hypothetical protein
MSPAPQTDQANPNPAPTESRDACGRFAKGNSGGPGNPYPRRVAALRQALLNCVTEDDITAIAKAVIEEAKGGNIAAAKLIFHYVLGKPASAADQEWYGEPAAAPIANGSNGNAGERKGAPKANGSNGGNPAGGSSLSGQGAKAQEWLDRQVGMLMERLGSEPLVK